MSPFRKINEYEFVVDLKGKRKIVQQSAHNQNEAEKRIASALKGAKVIKRKRVLHYPHFEGGRKI